ncbi:MAG TPA: hypothetical protein IAB59_05905 [Candidatus Onthousia faecipullorum]|uniref:Uncharacterized protein n=1 Tax=Candidatus Onthousia faecipullorum TaxID=2840887 RepID=A0A9D1KBU2_9FIRM|nr:hypothetical protein [Candidatus Onthousia faecipullorum]
MVKNKKNILILGLVLLLIIAIVGVSYAVFNYSALGGPHSSNSFCLVMSVTSP